MATNLATVQATYKDLKSEWSKSSKNLKKCEQLLENLKVELTKMAYLPIGTAEVNKNEMIIARDVLEIAVQYSVLNKDVAAFERYMSQLKCYYYDYKKLIGESVDMYKLLGLNLLYLLSVNRVSEFHTELELLSCDTIQNNKFVKPILALEQYIMEGRYNKIFQAKNSAPADIYNYFMDILLDTVRDEIGGCIEKAYETISIKQAAKLLNLKSEADVKAFGKKRNWLLRPDGVYNFIDKTSKPREAVPSVELAEQTICYARELEMIV